jgi:iron complex transport system substrate-binding protein
MLAWGVFVFAMRTNRHRILRAVFWMVMAPLASRAQASPATSLAARTKAAEALVEFHDELGRVVHVPAEPQRIVSLAPSLTETVYALDLGPHLAGVTDFCDYPAEARTRPRVGGPINPNLEQIVGLRPDVVLATRALNRPETVEALDRLGVAVYTTDPRSVEDVIASTRHLGKVLGAEARAESLATELQRRLAELSRRLSGRPPRRVFFVVWTDPIISTGPHTFLADALRRAGAESVVSVSQDWPQISIEELLRQDPEYLVFSGTHPDDAQSTIASLQKRAGWSSLEAVREGHFAVVSDALARPAPRLLDAIEDLARQLHPEVFPAVPGPKPLEPGPRRGGRL